MNYHVPNPLHDFTELPSEEAEMVRQALEAGYEIFQEDYAIPLLGVTWLQGRTIPQSLKAITQDILVSSQACGGVNDEPIYVKAAGIILSNVADHIKGLAMTHSVTDLYSSYHVIYSDEWYDCIKHYARLMYPETLCSRWIADDVMELVASLQTEQDVYPMLAHTHDISVTAGGVSLVLPNTPKVRSIVKRALTDLVPMMQHMTRDDLDYAPPHTTPPSSATRDAEPRIDLAILPKKVYHRVRKRFHGVIPYYKDMLIASAELTPRERLELHLITGDEYDALIDRENDYE